MMKKMLKLASVGFAVIGLLASLSTTAMASTKYPARTATFTPGKLSRTATMNGSSMKSSTVSPNLLPGGGGGDVCTSNGGTWEYSYANGDAYVFGLCSYDGGKTGTPGYMVTDWVLESNVGSISRVSFVPTYDGYYQGPPVTQYPSPNTTTQGQFEEYLGQGSHQVVTDGSVLMTNGGGGSFENYADAYIASN